MVRMAQRLFTAAQATKTLPLVKRIVADILDKGRELRRVASAKDSADNRKRLEELGNEIHALMAELQQIGCEYRDWSFDHGLVDFPAIIDGKHVSLCWRGDEPAITWYHEQDAGFLSRKPIPPRLLAEETEIEATELR